ncbi:MAG: polymerase, sigma-24 subunit, subfamily [Verrucomicrobia bacterium]|nr:polymerase, sigma-24 subunit, subfamily [Verrucomicrobiota bacterium]
MYRKAQPFIFDLKHSRIAAPFRPSVTPPHSDHERWFAEEVQPHDASLRSYVRGAFPTVRDVEDVVQESYLRIWRARLERPINTTKSFLFQIARHLAIDFVRRERISPLRSLPDSVVETVCDDRRPGVAEAVCTHDELAWLARALDALPARCREVMILRQIEGVSQKEIAVRLGLSELTVQTHVVQGLRRLEAYFSRQGLGPTQR